MGKGKLADKDQGLFWKRKEGGALFLFIIFNLSAEWERRLPGTNVEVAARLRGCPAITYRTTTMYKRIINERLPK